MHNDHYRRLSRSAAPLLAFSCAMFLCLALVYFIALPQWASFSRCAGRLNYLEDVLSEKSGAAALKSRFLDLQDSLKSASASLSLEFGETRDLPGILRLLIAKANAADIRFVRMQPQTETALGATVTYPIILELTTTYHSLGRFISSIESMPHLVRVDRLALIAGRNTTVEARILVTCFFHSNG
jgi:Tfp pilus assembly protein PilO